MQRWQDDGEHIDDKGCQKAWKYLNTKRMVPDINQREMKEDVCRLEVVKREFIKEPSTCVIKYYESKWIHDQYSTIIAIASSFSTIGIHTFRWNRLSSVWYRISPSYFCATKSMDRMP